MNRPFSVLVTSILLIAPFARALDKPQTTFPVFQFPADKIPRIDGDAGR